jgi:iron complex outermembrane receptor protein/vitamin B12 transporter
VLLTSAAPYTPSVGQDFYGARTAVITRNIVMQYTTVSSDQTVIATGIPTPIQQLPTVVTLIPQSALATQIGIVNDLRQATGTNVVQAGQAGRPVAPTSVAAAPTRTKSTDASSTDIGGDFNYGPVSTTALAGPELYRGANSALTAPAPKQAQ